MQMDIPFGISDSTVNNALKTERFYTVSYAPKGKNSSQPPAITLKGHWLKAAGFEAGFTFTMKILNGCLVLIPDSEDIRTIKQQNQQKQAQIAAFNLKVQTLIGE